MATLAKPHLAHAAHDWLAGQGWRVARGPDIAPGTPAAECDDYGQVVLERRLHDALPPNPLSEVAQCYSSLN